MFDRVGPIVTAISAAYVVGGQLIDDVNTITEYVAVILAAGGVAVGAFRVLRRGAKIVVWADTVVELLQGLEHRLQHGDARMTRMEEALQLEPMPFRNDDDRHSGGRDGG